MGIANIRVLALSLVIAAAVGAGGGIAYGFFTSESLPYGIATGFFLVGLAALALGLLGATEPPQGWSSRRRAAATDPERRSFASRLVGDIGPVERVSSAGLVVWASVVGGGLIGLSFLLFAMVS